MVAPAPWDRLPETDDDPQSFGRRLQDPGRGAVVVTDALAAATDAIGVAQDRSRAEHIAGGRGRGCGLGRHEDGEPPLQRRGTLGRRLLCVGPLLGSTIELAQLPA